MKTTIVISLYFIFLSVSCLAQADFFKIDGVVENDYEGYIYLSSEGLKDSALVKDKSFTFKGNVEYPVEARLHLKDGLSGQSFYLENSVMQMKVSIHGSITNIQAISGNHTAEIESELVSFFQEMESDPQFALKLYEKLDSIFTENPNNQFCGMILGDLSMDPILSYQQLTELYSRLNKSAVTPDAKRALDTSLEKLKKYQVGKQLNSFEFADKDGQKINVADFEDEILLIEFWASWCAPCREINPELREIYEEYKDAGFEVFGVSLDLNKEAWLKAIEKDGLPWENVIAEGGWSNQVIQSFGIQSIPSNFLIDKNGTILAVNIKPLDMKKKLDDYLKN